MQDCTFRIFTDSGCDISPALLAEWGVRLEALTFRFNDSKKEYTNEDMAPREFYEKMRNGGIAKTAAVNSESFASAFEDALKQGLDVLYVGFSSGISNTYNAARIAAEELRAKYPERKIFVIDTLTASAGEGLLVWPSRNANRGGPEAKKVGKSSTQWPAITHAK